MTRRALFAVLAAGLITGCDSVVDPAMREGGFVQLAVGWNHSCALTAGGSAYCWGSNAEGQLGNGSGHAAATPVLVPAPARFRAITAGGAHSCALTDDDALYCWGANQHQQAGAAGSAVMAPQAVLTNLRFTQISAGAQHTCGRSTTGVVYCWGANGQAQSGGTPSAATAPRGVLVARPLVSVSAGGFHSCALDDRGTAWCWGGNNLGQLGTGDARDASTPLAVAGTYSSVAAGYLHTCAIAVDASAHCWGSADHGEIGTGGAGLPGLPGAMVPAGVHNGGQMNHIVAGVHFSCATRITGEASCWGRGTEAQLGNGQTRDAWTPQPVSDGDLSGFLQIVQLGAGARHACALLTSRAVYCWGDGREGQLGAGELRYSALAVRVRWAD